MKLHLENTPIEDLNRMLADFQAKVNFLSMKRQTERLAEATDLLNQVQTEIDKRKK